MKMTKQETINEIKRHKVIVVPTLITSEDLTWVRVYKNDLLQMMGKKSNDNIFDVTENRGELIVSSAD